MRRLHACAHAPLLTAIHAFHAHTQTQGETIAAVDRSTVDDQERGLLSALLALHQARTIRLSVAERPTAPLADHRLDNLFALTLLVELLPAFFSSADDNTNPLRQPALPNASALLLRRLAAAVPPAERRRQIALLDDMASAGSYGPGQEALLGHALPSWPDDAEDDSDTRASSTAVDDVRDEVFAMIRPTGWSVEMPDPQGAM